jgi:hypothetical protein
MHFYRADLARRPSRRVLSSRVSRPLAVGLRGWKCQTRRVWARTRREPAPVSPVACRIAQRQPAFPRRRPE